MNMHNFEIMGACQAFTDGTGTLSQADFFARASSVLQPLRERLGGDVLIAVG
jgi:hypothetical protein